MRAAVFLALLVVAGVSTASSAGGGRSYAWDLTPTGTNARLRGVSAISANTAWASGSGGTVLRTVNGGQTWQQVPPPGTATLQFRDIEAFDANHAVILSTVTGTNSRVYATSDAGQHWTLTFTNNDPDVFYDCMTFFDSRRGLALSDPVDGRFRIIATDDGGNSWHVVERSRCRRRCQASSRSLPAAYVLRHRPRTCVRGSGPVAAAQARVFRSDERRGDLASERHAHSQRAECRDLRARLPRPAARIRRRRRLRNADGAPDALALTADGGSQAGSSSQTRRTSTARGPPG